MFRFDHIALVVSDPERTAGFYEALGGRRVSKPSPHFIEIMLGEVRLHITPAETSGGPPASAGLDHFCAFVNSAEELASVRDLVNQHPSTRRHGPVEIQQSPPMDAARTGHCEERVPTQTLYFRDPDGVQVEIRRYSETSSPRSRPA